jgi:hypothetical protein
VATVVATALVATGVASAQPRVGQLRNISVPDLFPNGCGQGQQFAHADFETHLAVNPRRPRHMIATWIEGTGVTVVTAATHDGGRTWRQSKVPGLHCTGDPETVLSGDPWVAFGRGGRAYLVLGTDVGSTDPAAQVRHVKVMASHSSDNGDTWARAKVVEDSQDFNDKYAVTADRRRKGRAWIVWTKARPPSYSTGDVYLSDTRNAGRTWSPPRRILAPTGDRYPWGVTVRVLPGGDLLLTTMIWRPLGVIALPGQLRGNFQALSMRSRDDGRTWSAPVQIANVPVGNITDPDGGAGGRVRTNEYVALDVSRAGTALAAWQQRPAGGGGEIAFSRSADGGRHWSAPRAVPGAGRSAFLPALAAYGRHGVGITYYDLRRDRTGDGRMTTDVWFAFSGDEGGHWRTIHLAGPFDMRSAASVDDSRFVGDYFGLAATPRGFAAAPVLARPVARGGPSDVFYAPIRVGG